jgi:hypothetical protein
MDMTPAEILTRAEHAKRILEDPLVVEAFATIERDVMEAFFACPVRDAEGMRILQTDLRLARQFKGILQGAIERGKLTANDLREKETLMQQTLRKFRR